MNIFASSKCPKESARYLDDLRVNKMILESCQLLNNIEPMGWKQTHRHHPCSLWLTKHENNPKWLLAHLKALLKEFRVRNRKTHSCEQYISQFTNRFGEYNGEPVEFINCTTNHKHIMDVHEAYKQCLIEKWSCDKRPARRHGITIKETK